MQILTPLLEASDITKYGGKAGRLAYALSAGFPVPNGFVLSNFATRQLRFGDEATLAALRRDLATLIQESRSVGLFAVRSSGVAEDGEKSSFAGGYRTLLNIEPDVDKLLEAIQECIHAANSIRLKDYAAMAGINDTEKIAIVIQHMVPAELAGVAFSESHGIHADYVLIEAVAGLGETLVSGVVTPSRYLLPLPISPDVKKRTLQVTGDNQLGLFVYDIAQLALLAAVLFNAPQDIEWAIVDGKSWLLQSRPITAAVTVADEAATATDALLNGFGAPPGHATAPVRIMRTPDDSLKAGQF